MVEKSISSTSAAITAPSMVARAPASRAWSGPRSAPKRPPKPARPRAPPDDRPYAVEFLVEPIDRVEHACRPVAHLDAVDLPAHGAGGNVGKRGVDVFTLAISQSLSERGPATPSSMPLSDSPSLPMITLRWFRPPDGCARPMGCHRRGPRYRSGKDACRAGPGRPGNGARS